jgi:glycosyltransferase involved in cell wall biosynthesis
MRIRFAITGYLPELIGGAEIYTQNLARELIKRGHDVGVMTLDLKHKRGYPTDEEYEGVPVHRLGFLFEHRPPALYAVQFYPEMYDEALAWLERERPDVVHVSNSWFIEAIAFAAIRLGIPVVGTHVDYLWTCRDSHLLKPDQALCGEAPNVDCRGCHADVTAAEWPVVQTLRAHLFRLLAQGYAYHHCPCPYLGEHIASLGVKRANIGVWPYGIPPAVADQRAAKTPSDVLRLAFIGRWNRMKGIHVLLDAMEQIRPDEGVRLHLYGEQEVWNTDSYGAEQAARVKALPHVEIKGRFGPEDVVGVHRQIDVLVTPSIWPENSPVSMLEALALGTPCLCADGQGMVNLIESGQNGLIFRGRDATDLARKIRRLARSPRLVRRLQANARCLRTIDEDARAFEKIYRRAKPVRGVDAQTARDAFAAMFQMIRALQAPPIHVRKWREKMDWVQANGYRRIALFGAGRHTLRLLDGLSIPKGIELVAIFDENPSACGGKILGVPVQSLAEATDVKPDVLIVSSDAWETQMLAKAAFLARRGIVVTGLYGG